MPIEMIGIRKLGKELGIKEKGLKIRLQSLNILDAGNTLTPAAIERGCGCRHQRTIYHPGSIQVVVRHNVFDPDVINNLLLANEPLPTPEPKQIDAVF